MFNATMTRFMAALAAGRSFDDISPFRRARHKVRPTGKALRNPSDPVQAKRIATAEAKRERKARKLTMHTHRAMICNNAHAENGHPQGGVPRRLHPFYVNRGQEA